MDEDFAGCCKRVAMKSKHPATIETRVLEKCRLLEGVDAYYAEHPELVEIPEGLMRAR